MWQISQLKIVIQLGEVLKKKIMKVILFDVENIKENDD